MLSLITIYLSGCIQICFGHIDNNNDPKRHSILLIFAIYFQCYIRIAYKYVNSNTKFYTVDKKKY